MSTERRISSPVRADFRSIPFFDPATGESDNRVIPIDKPTGITSFDVVRQLRKSTGIRKIGHAGTLDPLATGLLICMTGDATRYSRLFMELPKTYTGTIRLGEETPSFDSETPVSRKRDASVVTDAMIDDAAQSLTGQQVQLTPSYAAVKVEGKPLYAHARAGKKVTRPPRIIDVFKFVIVGRSGDDVRFEIDCSTGTYIRTIAHDLGKLVGAGGHLTELRRRAIGDCHVADAFPLENFKVNARS